MSLQNFNIFGLVDIDEVGVDDGERMPMTTIQEYETGIAAFKNDGTYLGVMSRESSEVCWVGLQRDGGRQLLKSA